MCLAIPGKVIEIDDDSAIVDYGEEKRDVGLLEKDIELGDYVIVQNRFIVQKISKEDALRSIEVWKQAFRNDEIKEDNKIQKTKQ